MYIFFASNNSVSSQILEGEKFRQGDVNANTIYASSVNYTNFSYMAWLQFEKPDGTKTPEIPMTISSFTYLGVVYNGFKFTIEDPIILSQHGELKATVRYRNGAGVIAASGTVVIPVEQTVYEPSPSITLTQYNVLLSLFDKYLQKVSRYYPHVISALPEDLISYLIGGTLLESVPEDLTDYEIGAILFVAGAGDELDKVYEIYDNDGVKDIREVYDLNEYLEGTILFVKPSASTAYDIYEVYDNSGTLDTRLIKSNQEIDLDEKIDTEIGKIIDGTYIVKKAEQDKNSNDIFDTYETKSDATTHKARTTILETFKNTTVPATYATKSELSAEVSRAEGVEGALDTAKADKATTLSGYGITNAYTKTEADNLLNIKADLVDGKVPSSQLPSYVDDVLEYANLASFPATGETGKIYVALDTNKTYRWSGSAYVEISASLALGETSSTAYRGDRGKTAYDHSQVTSGNPHSVTKSNVGLGNVDNTSDANKPVSTAQQTALNSKIDKMTLLNMLLNNNFESSTSWAGVNGTITDVSSNVLTLTGNSQTATYTSIVQSIASISGHKYYMKSWMRCADIGNSSLRISWANQLVTFSTPSPDVWYDVNGIITSSVTGNSNFQFQLLNTIEKVKNKVLYIKKAMLIDLTAIFGAGNEPTLQAINEVLSEYDDGWFNIALTLSLAEQIKLLPATETLITNKINNGNFTSANGWTTVNGSLSVAGNIATLLGNVTATNMSMVQVFPTIAGHKYYFHIFAKISGVGTIRMAFGTPTYASLFNDSDVWHEVSTVYQAPSTTFNFLIQLLATNVDTMTLQAKSIVSIDLTDVFGAGKEPTTRQMDYVINSFPDSFFDGSTSLISDNIINSLLEYSAVPTKGKSLLCFGDSITQTATVSNNGATYTEGNRTNWPTFSKVDLGISSMYNYAKAGASFEEKSKDDMQKVTYQISSAIANSRAGDIIVVSAGTNDRVEVDNMSDYNTAMGKATLADLDRTKVYEALRWCFWTIKENYPNAICFCATPIQRASSEQPPELIEAITKMAKRYNFIIIDAFNESGIVRENEVISGQGAYLSDGTHPDINGQRLLANLYSAKILEYFIK